MIMNERTKTGLKILQVAVLIGILGDILLRVTPWGLNVLLFNLAFAAGMLMLLRRRGPEYLTWQTIALLGAQIFFASMFVWRDSIQLRIADTFAILAVLSVLFVSRMKVEARLAGVFHYIAGFFWSALSAIGAPVALIFGDVSWELVPREGWRKHAVSSLRGIAIAVPLLLVFGALFMAADAAYEGLVQRVFNIAPETLFSHVLIFSAFAWLSAGYFRGILIVPIEAVAGIVSEQAPNAAKTADAAVTDTNSGASRMESVRADSGEYPVTLPNDRTVIEHINISDPPNTPNEQKAEAPNAGEPISNPPKPWTWADLDNSALSPAFTLGSVEVGIVLGLMNLLFLSFVIVQVPYLFGGMDLVQNTPDFKLAEYARRGFGELVAVSALVLPILLAGHWLIKKGSRGAIDLFRILAGIQIILLFVIMASAVQRLVLLTGPLGYGMTTVRLYPMIVMIWLAVVFVWFAATVLRGARQHFAWGALWSAFFILGATHVLNPDAFIVKTNLALMQQGREFDAKYNSLELSDDSLPVLFEALPSMSEADQQTIIRSIGRRYCAKINENDLRSWNIDRAKAWSLLDKNHGFVEILGGCNSRLLNRYSFEFYD